MISVAHPWHGVAIGDQAPRIVQAVVEIPKDSKIKYELDKHTGLLRMDRYLHSAVLYPHDYGFIPQTYWEDDDPMDIFILTHDPTRALAICTVKVIGVIRMTDKGSQDDKILAVHATDPRFGEWNSIEDVPQHYLRELKHFLETYKELEGFKTEVFEILGPKDAYKDIEKGIRQYKEKFGHNF